MGEEMRVRDSGAHGQVGPSLDTLTCRCGCGRQFLPSRTWQRFVDSAHKLSYWTRARQIGGKIMSENAETA